MGLNLGLFLSQKMKQELKMTPQLQQAIRLLQLSRLDLLAEVQKELMENPCLEEHDGDQGESDYGLNEDRSDSSLNEGMSAGADESLGQSVGDLDSVEGAHEAREAMDWEAYINADDQRRPELGTQRLYDDSEQPSIEATHASSESLFDHLLWQLQMSTLDETQRRLALNLIGNIDDQGYFRGVTLEELSQTHECSLEYVENILREVQQFDPVGVGARDLTECLLIQATVYDLSDLAIKVISEHLTDLEHRRFQQIARQLKVSLESIYLAAQSIRLLDPRPGRRFSNEHPRYVTPDVYVDLIDGEYQVRTNDEGLPRLQVSTHYRQVLKGSQDEVAKRYVTDKLNSAYWLIRSLDQRKQTIVRVMESILKFQRDFFERGREHLKPLILKDIAQDIDLHESTISRVTSNKYVYTPRGLFELKFFFNSTIQGTKGAEDLASEAVKEKIRKLIASEDAKRPYSDQKIADLLKNDGANIARRTVAKYREAMGFLPSSQRKKHF
jgi:RNA polymerase sigma-54 factor